MSNSHHETEVWGSILAAFGTEREEVMEERLSDLTAEELYKLGEHIRVYNGVVNRLFWQKKNEECNEPTR